MERNVNLKKVSIVLGVSKWSLENVGKKGKEGEVYVVGKINWEEIDKFIENRIKKGKCNFKSLEEVYNESEKVVLEEKVRKGNEILFGDLVKRKLDVKVGDIVVKVKSLKDKENEIGMEFEVKYVDESIVVLKEFGKEEVVSFGVGNRMFNYYYEIKGNK